MARTIAEIKKEMTDAFLANEDLKQKYGFDPTKTWETQFSRVSIENLLMFVVASSIHVLERLFDTHLAEVDSIISKRAHTLNWYRNKALAWQKGCELDTDIAEYDNSGMTDEEVAATQVVKKCSCEVVSANYPTILVKAAKADGTLDSEELEQFTAYMTAIADAGVRVQTRSAAADHLYIKLRIWYDPLVVNSAGYLINGSNGKTVAENGVEGYLANLPYNGVYYPQLLEQYLMGQQGIKMARVVVTMAITAGGVPAGIEDKYQPYSGALVYDQTVPYYGTEYINFNTTY